MRPTPEQEAILAATLADQRNLRITARAGTGKTSTNVMVAKAEPKVPTLCIAFNKRIADEMDKKLPLNCESKTINSLGHRAWSEAIGRRLEVNTGKNYALLKNAIDSLPRADAQEAYELLGETLDMISTAKTSGYVPDACTIANKRLREDADLETMFEVKPSGLQLSLIKSVMLASIKSAFTGKVDFDDQVLMPTVFSASFPMFPKVLVDEAQDLSELNHAMMRKLCKKRVIAVGDELQSIYAFRGAHQESMSLLQAQFDMADHPLSVTFRCPQAVVREAWWRAPNMRWPDWAIEGEVLSRSEWGLEHVPAECAIVCRNNAPLFGLAMKFLREGRNCKIVGNDIGKGLLRIMKKFGDPQITQEEAFKRLDLYYKEQEAKTRVPKTLNDRCACIRLFLEQGRTLAEACAYAEALFAQDGPVTFVTGHKSKGLEFDHVLFLDQHLVRHEEDTQEANLRYVIQTRAKKSLTYVTSEGFEA